MQRDMRDSPLFQRAESLYRALRQPGTGRISDAAEIHASPEATHAVFAGVVPTTLEGALPTCLCEVDLRSGDIRVLAQAPNCARLPKYSPDGRRIAFLSDRHREGDFQLYLLDRETREVRSTPPVAGWVEYLHWSPDGRRILLGVAGHGADRAGGQGAITSQRAPEAAPSWMPKVESGPEAYHWRRAWIYELTTNCVACAGPADQNIWESTWCGNDALAVIASPGPREGAWYRARLFRIDLTSEAVSPLYTPEDQLGWPATSPSGRRVAVVEAICSDRWVVAGELRIIDTVSGNVERVRTNEVDITHVEWRCEERLLLAGHRGFDTVVGVYDVTTAEFSEIWRSDDVSGAGVYVSVSGLDQRGDCVLIAESFVRAPEIARIRQGVYETVQSFDLGYAQTASAIGAVERVSWNAPDGLEILGWLLRPRARGPHPLVMIVHGGPVYHWRPRWLGRTSLHMILLLQQGYAVFLPNPRGSAGRGRAFTRHVLGDMGGADTQDLLSGLDQLVERGIADPKRLGVSGLSYGGYMSCWLITQDARFAAAVPVAPVTNHVTQHLISNIPHFVALFLADSYRNPGGKYFQRSPVMHAHRVRTPTLVICGALDRCTPAEEAVQFHSALREQGVTSVLVTYPEEGHGIRRLPAMFDYAARVTAWFEAHMPARG